MNDNDSEREVKKKVMLFGLCSMGGLYLIANWIVTQLVAADCDYNPLLGWNLFGIYAPFGFYSWCNDPQIVGLIPDILNSYTKYPTIALLVGGLFTYMYFKATKSYSSHGTAEFATQKDIDDSDLGVFEGNKLKESGVVIGINPFNGRLMLDNAKTHTLLIAPTRSGKGVNTIIPTGLVWKNSMFFFDVKGELWQATSGYRQKYLGQKVMKFEPLCTDKSAARWNPLAEINFMTSEEISDVSTISYMMVRPEGEKKGGGDPFWDNSATTLLNGVIMHLLYKNYQEKMPLPCPSDIMTFLASPGGSVKELFAGMINFHHVRPEQFMEEEYDDKETNTKKRYRNPLKEIYGEYIKDFAPFNRYFREKGILAENESLRSLDDIRNVIRKAIDKNPKLVCWDTRVAIPKQPFDDTKNPNYDPLPGTENMPPFHLLLTHPKVAEAAATGLNGADQTVASIMQTAQTATAIYQDPVVQANTAVSDFTIRDLLDPSQAVSLYLVMQVKDVQTVKPLSRLFINTLLSKLIRDMKFSKDQNEAAKKAQRLLLMLDEFPQLGKLECVELALAVCAGYGIKMCIIAQDLNQLNKEYTKDNSIGSNCHVHVYFTPNLDGGNATAESISKALGKRTITTVNHSDGGGLGKGSDSFSQPGRELMTPDEVMHMPGNRELVFIAGHKPIYGRKLRYYEEKFFMDRVIDPPPHSDKVTVIDDYDSLFAIHKAETDEKIRNREKVTAARMSGDFIEVIRTFITASKYEASTNSFITNFADSKIADRVKNDNKEYLKSIEGSTVNVIIMDRTPANKDESDWHIRWNESIKKADGKASSRSMCAVIRTVIKDDVSPEISRINEMKMFISDYIISEGNKLPAFADISDSKNFEKDESSSSKPEGLVDIPDLSQEKESDKAEKETEKTEKPENNTPKEGNENGSENPETQKYHTESGDHSSENREKNGTERGRLPDRETSFERPREEKQGKSEGVERKRPDFSDINTDSFVAELFNEFNEEFGYTGRENTASKNDDFSGENFYADLMDEINESGELA